MCRDDSVALAGPDVLVARVKGRELRLVAHPVGGGAGAVRFRFTAPRGSIPHAKLVASPGTVGLFVWTEDEEGRFGSLRSFGGPPAGPLAPLAPPIHPGAVLTPSRSQASGERLLVAESDEFGNDHFSVHEPGGAWIALGLPVSDGPIGFAGDLVAYAVPVHRTSRDDYSEKLVVREWRTGLVRWTAILRDGVQWLDLRADGSAVVASGFRGIVRLGPGGSTQMRVAEHGTRPVFAGDAIVFVRGEEADSPQQLMLAEPGRRPRTFGAPATLVSAVVADEKRVVWTQHDCVLVAEIADPPGTVPPVGPCARSELRLAGGFGSHVGRDRRVPVVLQCVAAPPPGCRGSVSARPFSESAGRGSRQVRFLIRPGARRRFFVRLTERAYAKALREGATDNGIATLEFTATTTDPAGRRSRIDSTPFHIVLD